MMMIMIMLVCICHLCSQSTTNKVKLFIMWNVEMLLYNCFDVVKHILENCMFLIGLYHLNRTLGVAPVY